ncbi:hypothetical protein LIER_43879 [Lithospermum erythrorhizon]|uniref:Uncharacterized protein n=1 Tax=Lithospermum erythrorhizon TaxID=34254 RepID=A0AAV3R2Q4_LITER
MQQNEVAPSLPTSLDNSYCHKPDTSRLDRVEQLLTQVVERSLDTVTTARHLERQVGQIAKVLSTRLLGTHQMNTDESHIEKIQEITRMSDTKVVEGNATPNHEVEKENNTSKKGVSCPSVRKHVLSPIPFLKEEQC